ncbi:hypothetical protein KCU92_g259, partial [Aureobasidium melanogenum]
MSAGLISSTSVNIDGFLLGRWLCLVWESVVDADNVCSSQVLEKGGFVGSGSNRPRDAVQRRTYLLQKTVPYCRVLSTKLCLQVFEFTYATLITLAAIKACSTIGIFPLLSVRITAKTLHHLVTQAYHGLVTHHFEQISLEASRRARVLLSSASEDRTPSLAWQYGEDCNLQGHRTNNAYLNNQQPQHSKHPIKSFVDKAAAGSAGANGAVKKKRVVTTAADRERLKLKAEDVRWNAAKTPEAKAWINSTRLLKEFLGNGEDVLALKVGPATRRDMWAKADAMGLHVEMFDTQARKDGPVESWIVLGRVASRMAVAGKVRDIQRQNKRQLQEAEEEAENDGEADAGADEPKNPADLIDPSLREQRAPVAQMMLPGAQQAEDVRQQRHFRTRISRLQSN